MIPDFMKETSVVVAIRMYLLDYHKQNCHPASIDERHMKAIRLECSVEVAEELSSLEYMINRIGEVGL